MAAESSKIFGLDTGKLLAGVVSLFIGIVVFDGERALTKIDEQEQALHDLAVTVGNMNGKFADVQNEVIDHESRIRILEREFFGTSPKAKPGDFSVPIDYKCYQFWTTDVQACDTSSPTRPASP